MQCITYSNQNESTGRILKRGSTSPPTRFGVLLTPPTQSGGSGDIFLAVKPKIVGVAGANIQWGCFVGPSCSQKIESTAFELILAKQFGIFESQ